jgi:hypothetical protein
VTPEPKRGISVRPSAVQRELVHSDDYDEGLYDDLRDEYKRALEGPRSYTPDQRTAIRAYISPSFGGNGYEWLNKALRNGDRGALEAHAPTNGSQMTYQQIADHLHAALDQTRTKRDLVSYRGVKAGAIPKLQVGDEITDDGFISTSMDPGEAQGFSQELGGDKGGATVFEISVPAGTHALAGEKSEHELLLRPGSTFRVVSVEGGFTKVVLV